MLFAASLAIAAAAAGVSASPVKRQNLAVVPLVKYTNVSSMASVVASGQARLAYINGDSTSSEFANDASSSGSVTNEDVSYVAAVDIGGKSWDLIVDTGSSNTWCGARTTCEPTSTGKSTGDTVSVSYGSGSFSGTEYTDTVEFADLTVTKQSIGSASKSSGFTTVDGIIGFGPVDLTEDTVSGVSTVPTFMDNLYSQGSISEEVLGVYFAAESGSDTDDTNGELTLGGTDSTKYTGSISYFAKATSGDASYYWGISIASFKYGTTTVGSTASGIVDTGTTLIYIPTSAYDAFLKAAGGSTDEDTGLAVFTTEPTQDFYITFGTTAFSLTPAQYLIPSAQYSYYGLTSGKYYSWINDGGDSGVDTIIGQKFMENYYAVFDTTNSRIGFAAHA